nr:MAG TPA: hypothetical protein [Caudoviricetes sp.]
MLFALSYLSISVSFALTARIPPHHLIGWFCFATSLNY